MEKFGKRILHVTQPHTALSTPGRGAALNPLAFVLFARERQWDSATLKVDAFTTRPTRTLAAVLQEQWSIQPALSLLNIRTLILLSSFLTYMLIIPATLQIVSQGRICQDNFAYCHTETEVEGAGIAQLVVLGLAVHIVMGSILLWGNFPVEGIFPLELTWVQTPFPPKLFRMRV